MHQGAVNGHVQRYLCNISNNTIDVADGTLINLVVRATDVTNMYVRM